MTHDNESPGAVMALESRKASMLITIKGKNLILIMDFYVFINARFTFQGALSCYCPPCLLNETKYQK